MIQAKIHRKNLFTPLRYPGGKTSLFQFFDETIKANNWSDVKYVEPYAGGAGAALSLLLLEKVQSVVINDLDFAVYAFWKSILDDTEQIVKRVEKTPITVNEWSKQKAIYKNSKDDIVSLGFATLFLNRTNRSGIMNAGPIGGMRQNGNYEIDARFNRQGLIDKIQLIAFYRDRIKVTNCDGIEVIKKYRNNSHAFFYVDPPYYAKGADLYMNAFSPEDHQKLAKILNKSSKAKWILTYDNVPRIRELYAQRRIDSFSLNYSAHHATTATELMIFSDAIRIIT